MKFRVGIAAFVVALFMLPRFTRFGLGTSLGITTVIVAVQYFGWKAVWKTLAVTACCYLLLNLGLQIASDNSALSALPDTAFNTPGGIQMSRSALSWEVFIYSMTALCIPLFLACIATEYMSRRVAKRWLWAAVTFALFIVCFGRASLDAIGMVCVQKMSGIDRSISYITFRSMYTRASALLLITMAVAIPSTYLVPRRAVNEG